MKCRYRYCNLEVEQTGRGRPREYCGDPHKLAERREREKEPLPEEWRSAVTGQGGDAALVDADADPDVQVVAAVHETIMLRNTFARLGHDARAELAVRCEDMADTIENGLLRNFRGAVSDD